MNLSIQVAMLSLERRDGTDSHRHRDLPPRRASQELRPRRIRKPSAANVKSGGSVCSQPALNKGAMSGANSAIRQSNSVVLCPVNPRLRAHDHLFSPLAGPSNRQMAPHLHCGSTGCELAFAPHFQKELAGVAQWQSTSFVNWWLGVQVPSPALTRYPTSNTD